MSASRSDAGTEKGARRTFAKLGCAKSSIARMVQKLESRGLTIVIVEHSAEPLVLSYSAVRLDRLHWNKETIVESLMVPLPMIMRHKLANRISQRVFTKEDHLLQAILLNRSDEPFRISIQIRRLRRQFDGLDSDCGKRS